jgi:hypothetical protein
MRARNDCSGSAGVAALHLHRGIAIMPRVVASSYCGLPIDNDSSIATANQDQGGSSHVKDSEATRQGIGLTRFESSSHGTRINAAITDYFTCGGKPR